MPNKRVLIHIDVMDNEELPPEAYEGGQLFQRVDSIEKTCQNGAKTMTGLRYWFIKEVPDADNAT